MNISDACFLCVCEVQRGAMETMEQRDAIAPSHINSPGRTDGRGWGAMREGPVCLCLPSKRAVFLMGLEINGGGAGGRERGRGHNETRLPSEHNIKAECIYNLLTS